MESLSLYILGYVDPPGHPVVNIPSQNGTNSQWIIARHLAMPVPGGQFKSFSNSIYRENHPIRQIQVDAT